MDSTALARIIDHTLLRPEATESDVRRLCADAVGLGVFAVCVSPTYVATAADALRGSAVKVATVAGFPSGAHHRAVKAAEASRAVRAGAHEVDMVLNLGAVKSGSWDLVHQDIAEVRSAIEGSVLKVILETAALTDEEIVRACQISEEASADFVKTSTGFHSAGGSSVRAVQIMHATVGGRLGIKASGGVSTRVLAEELVAAGATRLGMSATAQVLGQ